MKIFGIGWKKQSACRFATKYVKNAFLFSFLRGFCKVSCERLGNRILDCVNGRLVVLDSPIEQGADVIPCSPPQCGQSSHNEACS